MKVYFVTFALLLVVAGMVVLGLADIADICAGIARTFFLVTTIVFMLSSAIGLALRHRA